jgi:ABC-2 type transport system permease protein
MPFDGVLCALIAAACAVNLYGGDGSSLWCTVITPRASRADVRGRQLAWLVLSDRSACC